MKSILLNGLPTASDCAGAVLLTDNAMRTVAISLINKQSRQSMVIALIHNARQSGNDLLANYMEAEACLTFEGFKMIGEVEND